jgi:FixJ family two-component response regulator
MKHGLHTDVGIIDDDVSFREALAGLVESFGFCTVSFASAHEFLLSGRSSDLRCLIVDVQMPGMSGLELQGHLALTGRDIPIILVTSYPDSRVRWHALRAGAVGILDKPFDPEDLLHHVRSALDRK